MTQFHRVGLVSYLVGGSALSERQAGLAQTFQNHGYGLASAQSAALGSIEQTIQAQAQTMAYNDAFLLIGAAFAFAFPLILLLQRPKPGAAPVAMH